METKKEIRVTKKIVEKLLEENVRCRNSDKWLIYETFKKICADNGKRLFIPFELFNDLPAQETITRVRRQIQHAEGRLLPTDQGVAEKRKLKQAIFTREFKY